MRDCVIVGRPNSGKTMFALNFAAYLGCKTVDITFKDYDNLIFCKHYSLLEAKQELCGMMPHKTRGSQSMMLKLPVGKGIVNFKLTDTCGISEEIADDVSIRRSMALAIGLMRSADYIIHIIDATSASEELAQSGYNIDLEIYNYGLHKKNYLLLANKNDLMCGKNNMVRLLALFAKTQILPISALYAQGFKEVKNRVARNI